MSRASRARRVAAAAVYGGGLGLAGVSSAGLVTYTLLRLEAASARRVVGKPFEAGPEASDIYGGGLGPVIDLAVVGDSLAAGLGADNRFQTIGGILAVGVSALAGRPVRLTNKAQTGGEASWLDGQLDEVFTEVERPDVAVVIVGGNDVTHRVDQAASVRDLVRAVTRLRESGAEVVVGTCPDLGTIQPLPQPLKSIARRWSRDMAAAQTVAVVEAGGRTVSTGDLLSPDFLSAPEHLFSEDRFHPSSAGYARVASALLPSVCAALGLWPEESGRGPDRVRGEAVEPVSEAARHAVVRPGSEVSGTEVAGRGTGPRGRWAKVLRRRRPDGPPGSDDDDDGDGDDEGSAVTPYPGGAVSGG